MIAPIYLLAAALLVAGRVSAAQESPVVVGAHAVETHAAVVHEVKPQGHYAPAGLVQVVGAAPQQFVNSQQQQQQPIQHSSSGHQSIGSLVAEPQVNQLSAAVPVAIPPQGEQYGQPESASVPPNYKPWGSWGLYIGGNPADGYYSSYYKALGQSVADKQQVGDSVKPGSPQAVVSQASGLSTGSGSPMLRQGSFPYTTYQDSGYPYDSYYKPADLNSGSHVALVPQPQYFASYPRAYSSDYPVHAFEQPQPQSADGLSYAPMVDMHAGTKRVGVQSPSFATKSSSEQAVVRQQAQLPAKGYQQRSSFYSYGSAASPHQYQSPVVAHQQVVAYPVPVGSQIVGSQPGVEGSFAPFGVHGFTRYAIKPTVVSSGVAHEPAQAQYHHGVHSAPVSQFPAYKQTYGYQAPLGFYGYPLSQLHYSQESSLSPSFGPVSGVESPASSPSSGVQQPQGQQSPVAANVPLGMPAGVQYEAAASSIKEEVKPAKEQ